MPVNNENVPGGQPIEHAWEDDTASEVIKFNDLCNYGHLNQIRNMRKIRDLQDRFGDSLILDLTKLYNINKLRNVLNEIKHKMSNCPEIKIDRGSPRFLYDIDMDLINPEQYAAYDEHRADCIAIAGELKKNLKSDLFHYPDPKIDEIRNTQLQLLDTNAKEYARAAFLNPSINWFKTSGGALGLGINQPVSKLKQQLGTDTFNTLADNRILSNKEMLAAVETENLLAKSEDKRKSTKGRKDEQNHLCNLWLLHKKTIENFEAVCNINIWEPLKTTTKIKKPPPNGDFHNQAMKYPYFKL